MRRTTWIALLLLALGAGTTPAQVTFTKVADSNTAIPNGTGTFTASSLGLYPSLSGNTVVFGGLGSGGQAGIYSWTAGTLTRVADKTTAIPSGTGNFTAFGSSNNSPTVSGNTVTFGGFGSSPTQEGKYTSVGGVLTKVADFNTPTPNWTNNFTTFTSRAVTSGNTTVFAAQSFNGVSTTMAGIYANTGGTLSRIVDRTTILPGSTNTLAGGAGPTVNNGVIAFWANSTGQEGIYRNVSGVTSLVANRDTAIPGGTGNFTQFRYPAVSSTGSIAFGGLGASGQEGYYVWNGTSTIKIADKSTPMPGGGTFTSLVTSSSLTDRIGISGNIVAFYGEGGPTFRRGIYYGNADGTGSLSKLIDSTDVLEGKTILFVDMVSSGLDGSSLAFRVAFNDGSSGIYLANFAPVPEPASVLGVGALVLAGVGGVRRVIRGRSQAPGDDKVVG